MEHNIRYFRKIKIKGIESRREAFFYGFIFCFTVAKAWGLTVGHNSYKLIATVGLVFWSITLCCIKFSQKEFIFVLSLLFIGGLCLLFSGKLGVMLPFLLLTGSKGVEVERVLKNITPIWISAFIFKVFLVLTGVVQNRTLVQNRVVGENVSRYGMGYHPNLFHATFFIGIALLCYTHKRMKLRYYIFLFLLNIIVFRLSYSTTGGILTALTILGFALLEYVENYFVNYRSLSVFLGIFCVMPVTASFLTAFLYEPGSFWWERINLLFTGRLQWNYLFAHQYAIPLMGQRFDDRVFSILDNAYLFVLYRYGIVLFCIWMVGYILILTKCIKKNEIKKIFFCLVFLTYGFAEQFIQNSFMNFSMFFMCELMWKETEKNGED